VTSSSLKESPIEHAGVKEQPSGYRFSTADYHEFQVIAVQAGSLRLSHSGLREIMGAGDVALLRSSGSFVLDSPNDGYRGIFYLTDDCRQIHRAGPPICLYGHQELVSIAELVRREAQSGASEFRVTMIHLGRALAHKALSLALMPGAAGEKSDIAARARAAIDANLFSSAAIEDVIQNIPLSRRQIARRFHAAYGKTLARYRMEAKVAEAKRLLSNTTLRITDIAAELHFASSQYFASVFTQIVGCSPSEFRDTHAKRLESSKSSSRS
jgi:AraC-like DNA-binding protein